MIEFLYLLLILFGFIFLAILGKKYDVLVPAFDKKLNEIDKQFLRDHRKIGILKRKYSEEEAEQNCCYYLPSNSFIATHGNEIDCKQSDSKGSLAV